MTVYVDPLFPTAPSRKWPYTQACHMTASSIEELHDFAARLGLKRSWAQCHDPNPKKWHYDLNPSKRQQAIKMGALAISWRERVALLKGKEVAELKRMATEPCEQCQRQGKEVAE